MDNPGAGKIIVRGRRRSTGLAGVEPVALESEPQLDSPDALQKLLRNVAQISDRLLQAQLSGAGCNAREATILCEIGKSVGSTQAQLVDATGIDRSTLALLIQRLSQRGLVSRRRSGFDGRANSLALTPLGQQALSKIQPAVRNANLEILSRVPAEHREKFLMCIRAIIDPELGQEGDTPAAETGRR